MEISPVKKLMAKALDYRSIRQDIISSNIANVDTPFFRSKDISFEKVLISQKDKIFNEKSPKLKMAQTDDNHLEGVSSDNDLKPKIFFRDGHTARNDGNTVDLDVETTEMAKNITMYNATIAAMKKNGAIFRAILDASAKV